jgi:hypothetical protein
MVKDHLDFFFLDDLKLFKIMHLEFELWSVWEKPSKKISRRSGTKPSRICNFFFPVSI